MKIYNTLTKKKEDFVPLKPGEVKMYVCGPTVYNYIHIGNARPFAAFDTIRRYLEFVGFKVNYVQNFTDVDDKIIKKAIEENVPSEAVSERFINETLKDAQGLNVKQPTHAPKVTEEMDSIIEMIRVLIEKGFAYEVNGSVYFDTGKFQGYGKLSGKNVDELEAGARVEINDEKRNPMDFILWKPNKPGEPKWDSPWSQGRPGWHIECSAMSKKYLGDTIDIHAGGEDLIFPHHENEIAQSEAANGVGFVKYWMHNGFINVDNQKMSKSKGNFFTLREISQKYPYEVIRFFIVSAHYRSPLNFSDELLGAAENALNRIKTCLNNISFHAGKADRQEITGDEKALITSAKFREAFCESMEDDFNTANAVTAIFDYVKFANLHVSAESSYEFLSAVFDGIIELMNVLGLLEGWDISGRAEKTGSGEGEDSENNSEIEALITKRQEARKAKNYAEADAIRNRLNEMGIVLEDTPVGVKWSRNRTR